MAQFGTIADWLNYDKIRMASAKQNLLGEGIGAIGEMIGDLVEKKGKKKKDKPGDPFEGFKDFEKPALNVTKPNLDLGVITGTNEVPTLQQEKEKPKNDVKTIEAAPNPELPPPAELAKTDPIDLAINTNIPTETTFDIYNYSTQNYGGTLNISDSTKNASNLKKNIATQQQNQLMQFLLPQQATYGPLQSNSPIQRRRSVGVQSGGIIETPQAEERRVMQQAYNPANDPYLDEQGRAEMLMPSSTLGGSGAALAEGYNRRIRRKSYARKAFDKAQKGLEDVFSQLQIEDSGVDSIDASTQVLGQQAKKAFVELEANKYNMDPAEYTAAKQSIINQPKLIGQSMAILKQRVDDFAENRHLLSKGNNPETLDLLDSLSKNEGSIQSVMRNGKAYLVGKTAGGNDVDIPLSEIVNGRNDFKFLTRFDPSETLNTMVTKYSKIKKDAEFRTSTGAGIESKTLPISAFENDVKADFNKMLADENVLRSVVADYLDADFDTFEEIRAAGLDPKTLAVNELFNQFSTKFDPVSKQRDIQSYSVIDPEARALKLQGLKEKASGGSKAGLDSLSQTFSDPNFYASFESDEGITPEVIKATIGANAMIDEDDPGFLVIQDPGAPNQEIRIPRKGGRNRQKAVDILARQVFKADPAKIKLTPTVSQGGPNMPFTLPKK